MIDWPHSKWGDRGFIAELAIRLAIRSVMKKFAEWFAANKGKVGATAGFVSGILAHYVPDVAKVLDAIATALGAAK